jgi:uncharacterized protein YndB with AHSA1/START domain
MKSETDRIEKQIVVKASRARVWRALADAAEFGRWFGCAFEGGFEAGKRVTGRITNPPGYEHVPFEIVVERIEPERLFSYRWHPYAIDPNKDYSAESMTLVEMRLDDAGAGGGTRLTIVETGFDALPIERRAEALRMNTGGWGTQAERIAKYVDA